MNKEEYYKRLEKTTEKIKTDRCSEDEIANIERQKLYLAEHYISSLEQENQKYKEVIEKAIEYIESKNNGYCIKNGEEKGAFTFLLDFDEAREFIWKLLDILKEVE